MTPAYIIIALVILLIPYIYIILRINDLEDKVIKAYKRGPMPEPQSYQIADEKGNHILTHKFRERPNKGDIIHILGIEHQVITLVHKLNHDRPLIVVRQYNQNKKH